MIYNIKVKGEKIMPHISKVYQVSDEQFIEIV